MDTKEKDNKNAAKRKLIAVHDFNDKNGQSYKLGQRFEVDPEYGQELIRRGDANDESDPTASQLPAPDQGGHGGHGDRGAHASQPIADKDQKHRDSK